MRTLSIVSALAAAATGFALACASPAFAATPDALVCSGQLDTWTGLAGDTEWTTNGNWSLNAPPGATDAASLPTAVADNVVLNSDASVCELEMAAESSLLIDQGHTLTTQLAVLTGGPAANAYTSLSGQLATTDLHVAAGYTNVAEADANTPVDDTTTTFELDGGSWLSLSDSVVTLTATGLATLGGVGGTAYFDSNSTSDGDDSAKFDVNDTAQLAGTVDSSGLDVVTTASSVIDTAGHTWTVHGDAFSRFAAGTSIQSSSAGGVLAIGNQDHVLLSGATTVAHGATLRLEGTGMLTDGRYFRQNGAPSGTVGGSGTLSWTGGSVTGHITFGSTLHTVASGTGARHVSDPNKFGNTVLTNAGTFELQGGSLIVDGSLDTFLNQGTVALTGGHFGANTSSAPPLQNAAGGRWTFAPSTASSTITAGSFRNAGLLTIAANKTLVVGNAFRQVSTGSTQFTVSSSSAASRLRAGSLALAGTAHVSSASGFAPQSATVSALLKGSTRSGTFGNVVSTTHRVHTSWHLKYVGARVDAILS